MPSPRDQATIDQATKAFEALLKAKVADHQQLFAQAAAEGALKDRAAVTRPAAARVGALRDRLTWLSGRLRRRPPPPHPTEAAAPVLDLAHAEYRIQPEMEHEEARST